MKFEKRGELQMSEELDLSIDNYISDEFSICREERQYALYLSNVLRYYGKNPNYYKKNTKEEPANRIGNNEEVKKVFRACGFNNLENLIIDNVYYEATFMRDFFERNRRKCLSLTTDPEKLKEICLQKTFTREQDVIINYDESFNRKLIEFCINEDEKIDDVKKKELKGELSKLSDIHEKHYGMKNGSKEIPGNYKKYENKIRAMMNSKPDLAVIYHFGEKNEEKGLLFLECKFESGEAKKDGALQTDIQGLIAKFLKENYSTDICISSMEKPENSGKYSSNMIQFIRKGQKFFKKKNKDNEAKPIEISSLINLEREIFNKE